MDYGEAAKAHPLYQSIVDRDEEGGGKLAFEEFVFYMNPNVS